MEKFSYTIVNELGLHARPAGRIIKLLRDYDCQVSIKKNEQTVNAKSISSLMKLNVKQDDEVELIFDGGDEKDAVQTVKEYFVENQL